MNYRALVPLYRALLSSEGLCLNCGHPFDDEADIQIEHRAPPRHQQDWARLHARNLGYFCRRCNRKKSNKAHELWLDQEEEARLANEQARSSDEPIIEQMSLWNS